MKSATRALALVALTLAFALAFGPTAVANTIPTHGRSSYGSNPSDILTPTSPPPSFSSNGLTMNGESFCSFSNSSGDECALSEAYQITSVALPAGTTSVTITIPTAPGSTVEVLPPASVGILTNDSPGGNIFFTSTLTETQVLALPANAFSSGVDGSGDAFVTINDLSLLPGLAFYVDLLDASDPFQDGSGHFCSGSPTCSFIDNNGNPQTVNSDVPALATPEVTPGATQTAPEPGTLLSMLSGLSLLGFARRRAKG
jgi:hypothetical protein